MIEAVVTVPAMFHPDQIAATKKAIELAGLKLRYLLQEPTAAAIAYNEKKKFCIDIYPNFLKIEKIYSDE